MIKGARARRLFLVLIISALTMFLAPAIAQSADTSGPAAPATLTPTGTAQQGKVLTLEDAVRIGLENQSAIKSAQYQINAQDAVLHQQMSAYYPTVNFNNIYQTGNAGGGSSGGSSAFDRISSAVNMSMILYNFGKREGSVESAKYTLDATQYAYHTTANNTVLSVKQAYYGVVQANALLKVSEETVKDREETLRQTQGFYDVGTKPKSDVTQAQANLYIAQANLILVRSSVDNAWATLRNAMGVDEYPQVPLDDQLSVTPFTMSLDEAKKAAFSARPELRQFEALLKAQDQLIAVARRSHLPELVFNTNWSHSNVSNGTIQGCVRWSDDPLNPGCIKTGEHRIDTFPLQPSWQVILGLNIPIFNGFQTTYQVQQALSTYRSIKEQERVERQQVALQVEQSYRNVAATREAVTANEAAVKAAKENLDLHEGRYQVGYAPIVEVTDAQTTYVVAQVNYVNALVAYKVAVAQLANAMGAQ
ncbi:MAG: TolC family protein [Alphaproteobacteria bacterium]